MSDSTNAERVAAGAVWLDQAKAGWALLIDLTTLDMQHPCHCILGQIYRSYYSDVFGESPYTDAHKSIAQSRGFYSSIPDLTGDEPASEADEKMEAITLDYFNLQNLWVEQIQLRLRATPQP